ncbi:hypothetical protein SO802_006126 [Lithocarpus litseifolius]|uniref:Exocyst subunit Exo70 family protein n=1 Tax=Lithocarpus litseifolius TaxID=425828 RepID=A0AAW2DN51_9ROSI
MQQAMFRVEEEFRSLMERGGESFELSCEYGSCEPFDSDDNDDEDEDEGEDEDEDGGIVGVIRFNEENQIPVAQPIMDYNIIIDVLPTITINDLHEITKRMVAAGFGKECSHVYSSFRCEFLEESLSRLGLKKLSIEEVHKMPWQDLEDEIERWIKAANVSLLILFPSKRQLCDRIFFGFSSASDLSFMEVCRGSTIQLLNFADAVAIRS